MPRYRCATVGLCLSSAIPGESAVDWVDQGMVVAEVAVVSETEMGLDPVEWDRDLDQDWELSPMPSASLS